MESVKHENQMDAERAHEEAFQEASKAERWMAAVWRVKDGQLEILRCTTWNFPVGDYEIAARQLAGVGEEEKKRTLMVEEPPPLPPMELPRRSFHSELMRGNEDG